MAPLRSAANDRVTHEHTVLFHSSERERVELVVAHLGAALEAPETAVVLATRDELGDAVTAALHRRGADVTDDRLLRLDADRLLAEVVHDGRVDVSRYRETIQPVVARLTAAGRVVHGFGELVDLVWDPRDPTVAMELEVQAGRLAAAENLHLLCSYPLADVTDELATPQLEQLCLAHTRVLPTASSAPRELLARRLVAAVDREARAEQRCQQLGEELERVVHAERMREEFASMVAHDIRNPVSVITALLHLVRRNWDRLDARQMEENLDAAVRSAAQIDRLLEDLLLQGSMRSGRFAFDLEPFDLSAVVHEQGQALTELTGRPVDVIVSDALPAVLADAGRQRQILTNLLTNAVRFSATSAPLQVWLTADDDVVTVRVVDQGCGIAPDDQAAVFEPFTQVPHDAMPPTRGTGLGLAITKQLVEGQGGRISLESQVGAGTTITYTVPVARPGLGGTP